MARFGEGAIAELREIIDSHSAKRVLLVTGKASFERSGAAEMLREQLKGLEILRLSEYGGGPALEDVERCIAKIRSFLPQIVVAVGGGLAIDLAKAANALANEGKRDLRQVVRDACPLTGSALPMVAIPTTTGTGSEATHFAVVYVDGEKYSLAGPTLRPAHAIIDPTLSWSLPASVAAATGMDALSQSVESLWAVGSTESSRKDAAQAIELIVPAIEAAVAGDRDARGIMSKAAHLSGRAIDVSKTTGPHALSYAISRGWGVPHGHAVALTLGRFFELNAEVEHRPVTDPRGPLHVRSVMQLLFGLFTCAGPQECRVRWNDLLAAIGLESDPGAIGIRQARDVDRIVASVNIQRLRNNPLEMDDAALRSCFL